MIGSALIAALFSSLSFHASAQDAGIKFNSTPDDLAQIQKVLDDFRQDITQKNGHALTTLMLSPYILFNSLPDQARIDRVRKYNSQFDGIGTSDLDDFAKFISTTKESIEERFHNVEIHQDGELGLVTFNYDFVMNDKITNSGVEHWQLCKVDGNWKILSVVWTIDSHI
jgi:hypothetical protein